MPGKKKRKRKDGRPVRMNPYQATTWGSEHVSKLFDLEVPSGQRCQVRRMTPAGLVAIGALDRVDSLMTIVAEHLRDGKELDLKSVMGDEGALQDAVMMMDKMLTHVVIQPHLEMPPEREEDREVGVIYVDTVDPEDKTFIFQFAIGGTRELESFRTQQAAVLDGVDSRIADQFEAERALRDQ